MEKTESDALMWEAVLMLVALSSLNAISCLMADWIPYLRLCISLNGGHVEHIV